MVEIELGDATPFENEACAGENRATYKSGLARKMKSDPWTSRTPRKLLLSNILPSQVGSAQLFYNATLDF
jgi:hypothetical protein